MKRITYAFLLILIAGILATVCVNLSGIKYADATSLSRVSYAEYLNVNGEFESRDKTDIIMSYPICVKEIYVTDGQYVNRGQALFKIDKEKMLRLLRQYGPSHGTNLPTSEDIKALADLVRAPKAGWITGVNIYPGAVVFAGQPIISITGKGEILAKFTLSQMDFGKISVGDKVLIKSVAFDNITYNGNIADKNAVVKERGSVDTNDTLIEVFADINNPDDKVCGGLGITGKIQRGEEKSIKALDYSFIDRDSDGEFVYVLSNGKAEKRYVKTGVETDIFTEILSEFPDDTIFLKGDFNRGDRVIAVSFE